MTKTFEISVGVGDMLKTQPPQYAHLGVVFTAFCARVGERWFPSNVWTDFSGIWLFRWYEAVWNMAEHRTRAARLPFLHTYEIWLRRTTQAWWKVAMVERTAARNSQEDTTAIVGDEVLVIPEQVEVALLSASRKLLTGALTAGRWTEDCIALEALINDPKGYLRALDDGSVPAPRFLRAGFKIPAAGI